LDCDALKRRDSVIGFYLHGLLRQTAEVSGGHCEPPAFDSSGNDDGGLLAGLSQGISSQKE
jgi:hypothetical protein